MMKEITPYNFDEILFEYFEGTLNDAEKKSFLAFVEQNPSYKKDMELWGQSVVANDNIEVPEGLENLFTRKESFWKSNKGKWTLGATVAGVALLSTLLFNREDAVEQQTKPTIETTEKNEVPISLEKTEPEKQEYYNSANEKIESTQSTSISSPKAKNIHPSPIVVTEQRREENKATIENIIPPIQTDSAHAHENITKSVVNNSVNAKPAEETKKKTNQLKENENKLRPPKNIIPMDQKLGE